MSLVLSLMAGVYHITSPGKKKNQRGPWLRPWGAACTFLAFFKKPQRRKETGIDFFFFFLDLLLCLGWKNPFLWWTLRLFILRNCFNVVKVSWHEQLFFKAFTGFKKKTLYICFIFDLQESSVWVSLLFPPAESGESGTLIYVV